MGRREKSTGTCPISMAERRRRDGALPTAVGGRPGGSLSPAGRRPRRGGAGRWRAAFRRWQGPHPLLSAAAARRLWRAGRCLCARPGSAAPAEPGPAPPGPEGCSRYRTCSGVGSGPPLRGAGPARESIASGTPDLFPFVYPPPPSIFSVYRESWPAACGLSQADVICLSPA